MKTTKGSRGNCTLPANAFLKGWGKDSPEPTKWIPGVNILTGHWISEGMAYCMHRIAYGLCWNDRLPLTGFSFSIWCSMKLAIAESANVIQFSKGGHIVPGSMLDFIQYVGSRTAGASHCDQRLFRFGRLLISWTLVFETPGSAFCAKMLKKSRGNTGKLDAAQRWSTFFCLNDRLEDIGAFIH